MGWPVRMLRHDWTLVHRADALSRWQAINQSAVWSDHIVTATEQQLERPEAAVHHHLKMLRCGPSNQPFMHRAAFCRPNVGLRTSPTLTVAGRISAISLQIGRGETNFAGAA